MAFKIPDAATFVILGISKWGTGSGVVDFEQPIFSLLGTSYNEYEPQSTTEFFSSAVPTAGFWRQGDKVWNTGPSAAGTPGWVCTTGGNVATTGVFKAMAVLAA